jgi:hypothetical protein
MWVSEYMLSVNGTIYGFAEYYSSRHQIVCFKATEELHSPYRAALNQEYSVVSFATPRVLSCLHSPGLRCLS